MHKTHLVGVQMIAAASSTLRPSMCLIARVAPARCLQRRSCPQFLARVLRHATHKAEAEQCQGLHQKGLHATSIESCTSAIFCTRATNYQ